MWSPKPCMLERITCMPNSACMPGVSHPCSKTCLLGAHVLHMGLKREHMWTDTEKDISLGTSSALAHPQAFGGLWKYFEHFPEKLGMHTQNKFYPCNLWTKGTGELCSDMLDWDMWKRLISRFHAYSIAWSRLSKVNLDHIVEIYRKTKDQDMCRNNKQLS